MEIHGVDAGPISFKPLLSLNNLINNCTKSAMLVTDCAHLLEFQNVGSERPPHKK